MQEFDHNFYQDVYIKGDSYCILLVPLQGKFGLQDPSTIRFPADPDGYEMKLTLKQYTQLSNDYEKLKTELEAALGDKCEAVILNQKDSSTS